LVTDDGKTIRYGVWPCGRAVPRGTVLLLQGRKEFLEKYAETAGDLNRRGYDVYSFDWRGQGLSQRVSSDPVKGHVRDYREYLKDLAGFFDRVDRSAPAAPRIMLAHSMGAHIALRHLHDHPHAVARAVLTAPMIDIALSPLARRVVRALCRIAVKTGFEEALVPGAKNRDPLQRPFENNPLTSDPERFKVEVRAIETNPDLMVGGMTFGWLAASLASIRLLRKPGYAEPIRTPILILTPELDRVVCPQAQAELCSRLPHCRRVVVRGARHEVLMEADRIRADAWRLIDAFLDSPARSG
jgi:lysophospholipase